MHSTLIAAVLTPCAHLGAAFGCPALMAGSLSARSDAVARPDADRGAYVAGGVRLGAEHALGRHIRLEARLDLFAPVTPVRIVFDGATVWTADASGTLGAGMVAAFP